MLISYNTELIQNICFKNSVAIEYLGNEAAKSLQARHADIEAAGNIYELLVGRVTTDEDRCALVVSDILTIKMIQNYTASSDGTIYDWSTVSRVKIVGINHVE